MFGWTCGDCRLLFFCRRAMGCGQRPAFPAPSDCEGDRFAKLGRGWRREAADVYPSACVGDTKWDLQRRHCERSEAIQNRACGSGWLSAEVPRNDGVLAGYVLQLQLSSSAQAQADDPVAGGICYEPRSRGVLDPPPARSMTMCWMCNLAPHGCRKARIGAACSLTPSARHPPPSRCRRRR
jgi:hypothetical protein